LEFQRGEHAYFSRIRLFFFLPIISTATLGLVYAAARLYQRVERTMTDGRSPQPDYPYPQADYPYPRADYPYPSPEYPYIERAGGSLERSAEVLAARAEYASTMALRLRNRLTSLGCCMFNLMCVRGRPPQRASQRAFLPRGSKRPHAALGTSAP
jgi:hypothetical protein